MGLIGTVSVIILRLVLLRVGGMLRQLVTITFGVLMALCVLVRACVTVYSIMTTIGPSLAARCGTPHAGCNCSPSCGSGGRTRRAAGTKIEAHLVDAGGLSVKIVIWASDVDHSTERLSS